MGLFHELVMAPKDEAERLFQKTYRECRIEAQKDKGGQYGGRKGKKYRTGKHR